MTEILKIPASMGSLYGVLHTQSSCLLILSHGFGGSHTNHQDYADFFLSKGMSVFNLDFCGGGLESKSDGSMLEMTVLTEAADLNAVIDHFKNDPRFTKLFLMGFSQGGFVSSYVAAQRPEDVAGLVLEYPAYVLQDDARKRRCPMAPFLPPAMLCGKRLGMFTMKPQSPLRFMM
ncbi:MAG: alpha/beta hydrolase [Clostridiales bacterium]|nr:alpha/beta hydrolase [Clostridiales bacterium]